MVCKKVEKCMNVFIGVDWYWIVGDILIFMILVVFVNFFCVLYVGLVVIG